MADGDTKDGAGGDGALGRRGFLQLTAAGVVVAGTGLPAEAASAGMEHGATLHAPGAGAPAGERAAGAAAPDAPHVAGAQIARAHWAQRRVDYGEDAHIVVSAPGARDGTVVVAAVYRVVGRFHRYLGAARGRTQGGAARLAFRCAPIGPVDGEGLTPLVFRARVGAAAGRLFPPRALDVLCTRPRFSA
jgi:hypothetical protein